MLMSLLRLRFLFASVSSASLAVALFVASGCSGLDVDNSISPAEPDGAVEEASFAWRIYTQEQRQHQLDALPLNCRKQIEDGGGTDASFNGLDSTHVVIASFAGHGSVDDEALDTFAEWIATDVVSAYREILHKHTDDVEAGLRLLEVNVLSCVISSPAEARAVADALHADVLLWGEVEREPTNTMKFVSIKSGDIDVKKGGSLAIGDGVEPFYLTFHVFLAPTGGEATTIAAESALTSLGGGTVRSDEGAVLTAAVRLALGLNHFNRGFHALASSLIRDPTATALLEAVSRRDKRVFADLIMAMLDVAEGRHQSASRRVAGALAASKRRRDQDYLLLLILSAQIDSSRGRHGKAITQLTVAREVLREVVTQQSAFYFGAFLDLEARKPEDFKAMMTSLAAPIDVMVATETLALGAVAEAEAVLDRSLSVMRERHPTRTQALALKSRLQLARDDVKGALATAREAAVEEERRLGSASQRNAFHVRTSMVVADSLHAAFMRKGDAARAKMVMLASVKQAKVVLGDSSLAIVPLLDRLAEAEALLGERGAALRRRESMIPILVKGLGEDAQQTLLARGNLALSYIEMGMLLCASPKETRCAERQLARAAKLIGDADVNVVDQALTADKLGQLGASLGRLDDALKHYNKGLSLLQERRASVPREYASILSNRAQLYLGELDRPDLAVRDMREVLAIHTTRAERSGSSTDIALATHNLAAAQHSAGRLDEAIATEEAAHLLAEEHNREDRGLLRTITAMLAFLYTEGGRVREAEVLFQDALRQRPSGTERARIENNLANLYLSQGRNGEALAHFRSALKLARRVPTPEIELLIHVHGNVAQTAFLLGQYADALSEARESKRLARKTYGDDHVQVANMDWVIGASLIRTGQAKQAIGPLEEGRGIFRKRGSQGTTVGNLLDELADALEAEGWAKRAIAVRRELIKYYRATPQMQEALTFALWQLGDLLAASGEAEEALAAYRKLLAVPTKGMARPERAAIWRVHARAALADSKIAKGDADAALKLLGAASREAEKHDHFGLVGLVERSAGRVEAGRGRTKSALRHYSKATWGYELDDSDEARGALAFLGIKIGDILLRETRPEEAERSYRASIAVSEGPLTSEAVVSRVIARVALSEILIDRGDFLQGESVADEARRIASKGWSDDTDRTLHLGRSCIALGRARIGLRKPREALAAFSQVVDLAKKHASQVGDLLGVAELYRGNVLLVLGRHSEAERAFQQAAKAQGNGSAPAWVGQAAATRLDELQRRKPQGVGDGRWQTPRR